MAEATPTASPQTGPVAALHVSRTFDAPREQVFRAWTDADAVRRWFGSSIGGPQHVETDLRVGGSYRITVRVPPTGRRASVVGKYLEIDPPQRLVYTFAWEKMPVVSGMGDSKVTVEFREIGDGTEVRLTHELLDKRRIRSFHRFGWNTSMRRLARIL